MLGNDLTGNICVLRSKISTNGHMLISTYWLLAAIATKKFTVKNAFKSVFKIAQFSCNKHITHISSLIHYLNLIYGSATNARKMAMTNFLRFCFNDAWTMQIVSRTLCNKNPIINIEKGVVTKQKTHSHRHIHTYIFDT